MAQSNSQVNFRCPVELKKKLDDAASSSTRSLNAEIVHRLQESFVATAAVKNVASDKKALKEAVKEAMREMQEIESQVTAAAKTRSGRTSDKR